jgi:hypothetical protein
VRGERRDKALRAYCDQISGLARSFPQGEGVVRNQRLPFAPAAAGGGFIDADAQPLAFECSRNPRGHERLADGRIGADDE